MTYTVGLTRYVINMRTPKNLRIRLRVCEKYVAPTVRKITLYYSRFKNKIALIVSNFFIKIIYIYL